MSENWIKSNVGKFMVSDMGNIISTTTKERPFSYIRADGLECLRVSKSIIFELAEVFLLAFSLKPKNCYGIEFIDGDNRNYKINNLKWLVYDEDFIENVPEYRGYFVSTRGDVFSLKKSYLREKWKKLPTCVADDRQIVKLRNKNGPKRFYVHRLVLLAYLGQCPDGMEACHNDGNSLNNNLNNLRWDTHISNELDKFKHGTILCGEKNFTAKLTNNQVIEIINSKLSLREISQKYGITKSTACKIKLRQSWKHLDNLH